MVTSIFIIMFCYVRPLLGPRAKKKFCIRIDAYKSDLDDHIDTVSMAFT